MSKQSTLEFSGKVLLICKKCAVSVYNWEGNNKIVIAHAAGKLRKIELESLLGDKVKIEVSPMILTAWKNYF